MKIVPWWNQEALLAEVFVRSPSDEPLEVSLNRLARAIRADGFSNFYSPMAVWYAYNHHPSLSRPYNDVIKEYNDKRRKNTQARGRNG